MMMIVNPEILALFTMVGAVGPILMFIADLILYYPSRRDHRTASSYFETIDPGGNRLAESTMQEISYGRAMVAGAMGPVSCLFYTIGFGSLFLGLQPLTRDDGQQQSLFPLPASLVLPLLVSITFSLMMMIGAVYHSLFAYTCFISKEIAKNKKESCTETHQALVRLVLVHREYMRYMYLWAAVPCFVGSIAFCWCCLFTETIYSPYTVLFVPAFSGPLKKLCKRYELGGLVLCGGLTNLWNLCFFVALTVNAASKTTK